MPFAVRSRAVRERSLPMEWMVRLQHVRRILLSTTRPMLLDSTLVCLDYQLDCSADQLPDLPTFDGPQVSGGGGGGVRSGLGDGEGGRWKLGRRGGK